MNTYEQKQEDKKQRLLDASERAEQRSAAHDKKAHDMIRVIGGQPILVGHHSEKHHRADIRRIDNGFRKAFEESDQAKELQRRAEAVGTGGISSDDPDATQKLQEKIERLERDREAMKRINKAHAQYLKDPQTDLSGFGEVAQAKIRDYVPRYSWEPHPYPPYSFQNLGGRIRQAKKRIEQLQKEEGAIASETRHGDIALIENPSINRLQLIFPGKPSAEVRTRLKAHGFRWSPKEGAWQRQLNNGARYAAESVLKKIAS